MAWFARFVNVSQRIEHELFSREVDKAMTCTLVDRSIAFSPFLILRI
jgi:hypothetical protein